MPAKVHIGWPIGLSLWLILVLIWRPGHPRPELAHVESAPENPLTVEVAALGLSAAQTFNDFAGSVQSRETAQLTARVVAHVQAIAVHPGQSVKAGEVLLRLFDADLQARLSQAQAALAGAVARRDETQKNLQRLQSLAAEKVATPQQLDDAEAQAKNAAAAVQAAEQQVGEARANLGFAEIRAPFAGVIVDKAVEVGDLAAPGRTLLTLQNSEQLRLEAAVSESCASRFRVGDPARAVVDAAGLDLPVQLTEIVPAVDPQSRAFLVRADLRPHPDLRPGMFGRLRFPCLVRQLLAVPRSAVITRGQLDFVWVVQDHRAQLRAVRLGTETAGLVEILAGLQVGETIVPQPPAGLRDGEAVRIKPAEGADRPVAEAKP